jgi:drug/metabolite transporter (DMT)-like permease
LISYGMMSSIMRLRSDLTLFLVALIWGSAFAAQRVAAEHLGPFLFNGARFLIGGLVLLPLIKFRPRIERGLLPWVGLAGTVLFAASFLQQAGMQYTTAGNAGFITGLYVVLVPVLMLFFLRKRISWVTWTAALVATVGTLLLSTGGGELKLNPGDALELLGAVAWAVHVLLVGWLARRVDVMSFVIGQNLVSAVLNLVFAGFMDLSTLPGLMPAGWAVIYTGVFSVGVGYFLQGVGQKHAPPTDAALILSLESVFAAIFGFIFLNERLLPLQLLGCGLILAAIVWIPLSPAAAVDEPKVSLSQ